MLISGLQQNTSQPVRRDLELKGWELNSQGAMCMYDLRFTEWLQYTKQLTDVQNQGQLRQQKAHCTSDADTRRSPLMTDRVEGNPI